MATLPKQQKISTVWLKASVIGSLWASVEIILGSFFHNVGIPFAGTLLAMNSVALMVAFHQVWKEKGLFWRAGLICALMKSISPSAVLLGPMMGIFSEALLMEFATRIFGGNLLGYFIGGALALSSTIIHRIITLLVYYGFDFVTVLLNLYDYAVKQIGYPDLQPETALWFLMGIYFLLGMLSAMVGYIPGRKAAKIPLNKDRQSGLSLKTGEKIFVLDPDQKFSLRALFLHVFAVAVCLVLLNNDLFVAAAVFIVSYVTFCIVHYKRSLRHLKRPFFWVQVVVLTMLAMLFYNGFRYGDFFDPAGLTAGIKMNVRAILIVVGFSAISVELRNPVIKSVLFRRGFSQLYLSLELAFAALPSVIGQLAKPRQLLRRPVTTMSNVLWQANDLLTLFSHSLDKPKVFILTSEQHKGKTTFAVALAGRLKKSGLSPGGFVAPGKFENNRRSEFDIEDLQTGQRKPLCSIRNKQGEQIGPFGFYAAGQQFGNFLLKPENLKDAHIVFVDEIGPLELKDKGWAAAVGQLMKIPEIPQVWVVRKNLTEAVIRKWGLLDAEVFDVSKEQVDNVADRILKFCDKNIHREVPLPESKEKQGDTPY
jgi:nucleoside-triphosphatase THEP1